MDIPRNSRMRKKWPIVNTLSLTFTSLLPFIDSGHEPLTPICRRNIRIPLELFKVVGIYCFLHAIKPLSLNVWVILKRYGIWSHLRVC